MIDRSFSHHLVSSTFTNEVYNGTIFDGELVKTKEGFEYQIFDCIAVNGQYVGNKDHVSRISYASQTINNHYKYSDKHCFTIKVKSYSTPSQALEQLYEPSYPMDGWILLLLIMLLIL